MSDETERAARQRQEDINEAFALSAHEFAAKLGLKRDENGDWSAADEAAILTEIGRWVDRINAPSSQNNRSLARSAG